MKSQITMKDIASHFGVSLNTVHKAISGKPGIGEATRQKILQYAGENGYHLNTTASILKRRSPTVVICLPHLDENSRYFYQDIWDGCHSYLKEWDSLNIQTRELAFGENELTHIFETLAEECQEGHSIDGLLTVPPRDETGVAAINALAAKGVGIVFVTEDNPLCSRLGAVVGDYYAAGQLMAEQICHLLKPCSSICLLSGDRHNEAHYTVVNGFHDYIHQHCSGHTVRELFGYYKSERLDSQILDILEKHEPDAVLSVFARGSAVLYKALQKSRKAGKIPAIANDLFPESIEALEDGSFTNLVFKNPYKQAYLAMKMLCDYLVKEIPPSEPVQKVEIHLIFRSNLKYYNA